MISASWWCRNAADASLSAAVMLASSSLHHLHHGGTDIEASHKGAANPRQHLRRATISGGDDKV